MRSRHNSFSPPLAGRSNFGTEPQGPFRVQNNLLTKAVTTGESVSGTFHTGFCAAIGKGIRRIIFAIQKKAAYNPRIRRQALLIFELF
jgi:hypothetical protein